MKTRRLLMTLALLAPGVLGAEEIFIGDVANGRKLYEIHCAICHGLDGRGEGPGAAVLTGRPAVHRDGNLMNARDDQMLLRAIMGGCAAAGCKGQMPAFEKTLETMDGWDLVAYLRTMHLTLRRFFPEADDFVVKAYTIGQIGNDDFRKGQKERLQKLAVRVDEKDLTQTVFTLFKSDSPRQAPRLVPQEPQQLAQLKKTDRLGYLLFLTLREPRGRPVPVALALDNNYTIKALELETLDPAVAGQLKPLLQKYLGLGQRGQSLQLKSRDKVGQHLDVEITRLYFIAVEAANCYEAEERERSWADGTF